MAREPSVLNEDETADSAEETADTAGNGGLLHRRSYLKLAGTATATAAVAGVAGTAAGQSTDLDIRGDFEVKEHDDYTEIVCHDDVRIWVKDGQTIENLLIRNNGHYINFNARDTRDFVLRNIGVTDPTPAHGSAILSTATPTEGLVENVYLGEGGRGDWTDKHQGNGTASSKAMFSHSEHTGEITVRNVYFGSFADNTCYLESQGSSGNFHLENCYAHGGCISIFRLGGDGDHTIRNCHVENAGYHPDNNHGGARDVWIRSGTGSSTIDVYDSHLGCSGSGIRVSDDGPVRLHGTTQYGGGSGNIVEVDETVGSNPSPTIPDSVPTSAEEAAAGEPSVPDDGDRSTDEEEQNDEEEHDLSNVVLFDGSSEAVTQYEFVVSEDVEPSTDEDATIEDSAKVDGTHASGAVAGWKDAFRFESEIERLTVDGPATVYVNGEEVDPGDFDDVFDNVVVIDGSDEDVTRYEFAVGGDVEKSTYEGASIDDEDVIEDEFVHGVVADWKDAFRFDGDLEELTVDGPGTVYVNGEAVDPAEYSEELPHALRVEGLGVPTSYEITVDGSIELASGGEPEDEATAVSGGTVQSSTGADEVQEFRFSGAITDVTFTDGEAAVFVDDERIDPAEYGDNQLLPHALVIDGNGTDDASAYSFKVSGTAIKSDHLGATIDDGDVVEDGSVRGVVAGWLDAYWFDGNVEDLTLLGDATARVEYNARNQ